MTVTPAPEIPDPVESFEDFFRFYQDTPNKFKYREKIHELYSTEKNAIIFLYEDLLDYDPKLATELFENPEKIVNDAVEAFKNILRIEAGGQIDENVNYVVQVTTKSDDLRVPLHQIPAELVNKLVYVEGIVTVQGSVWPIPRISAYECPECGFLFDLSQEGLLHGDLIVRDPTRCQNSGCHCKKNFKLRMDRSAFINCQNIEIQGEREENFAESKIVLSHSLVNNTSLGDFVGIVGIYRGSVQGQVSRKGLIPDLPFLQALSIQVHSKMPDSKLTSNDSKFLLNLSKKQDLKDIIVQSIAPNVLGLRLIKEAAILACVSCSGNPTTFKDIREELFINIITDHEVECRKIIQFLHELVPFSRFSTGSGTTRGGLVARAADKWENFGKPFYAGTFLQAKSSVVFIRDLKIMAKKDQETLKELLGSQMIPNVPPQVPPIDCKFALVAITPPKNGAYDPFKVFTDNISLSIEFCSLFDVSLVDFEGKTGMTDTDSTTGFENDNQEYITNDILAKYIAYARSLQVTIPKDVTDLLKKFCQVIETPEDITRMYLMHLNQVLVRITIAYAKLQCHSIATKLDAEYAQQLVKKSLGDLGLDKATGTFDIDRLMTGHSRSQVSKIGKVLEILRDMEEENGNIPVDLDALKERVALECEMKDDEIMDALKVLLKEYDIIYPKNGWVKSVKH